MIFRSIEWAESPFFLYVAYNAPHFPLQAPRDEIEKELDTYRKGWDQIRDSRFQKMKMLGLLNDHVRLPARGHVTAVPDRNADSPYYDQNIPAWTELDAARREDLANRMATYAAMVRIMDRNVGRIVDQLSKMNCLENTVLVFLSDNGACAEWDPFGFDNNPYPKNRLYQGDELALMGGPRTFHSYGTDGPTHATHRFACINTTITKVASHRRPLFTGRWGFNDPVQLSVIHPM